MIYGKVISVSLKSLFVLDIVNESFNPVYYDMSGKFSNLSPSLNFIFVGFITCLPGEILALLILFLGT
jgi:hypothetical protein